MLAEQRSCAAPAAVGCRESDGASLPEWRCTARAARMLGQGRGDAWRRVRRCLAGAAEMHGDGGDGASLRRPYTFPGEFFEVKLHHEAFSADYQEVGLKKGTLKLHQSYTIVSLCKERNVILNVTLM